MTANNTSFFAKFIRDPLFHFLLAGTLIYAGYAWFADPMTDTVDNDRELVVTQGEIEWLTTQWATRWGRVPTDEELDGLIRAHVREIVLYREALKLGLDKEDVVIRRRLGQKLEFLSADLLEPEAPNEDELRAYFQQNLEKYRADDLITMSHVFLNPDQRGDRTLEDAAALKAQLVSVDGTPDDPNLLGDRFMLPNYFAQISERELAQQFGSGFARPVFELEPRLWHGPVLSGYGTHLVYIHDLIEAPDPKFDDASNLVLSDWLHDKRKELNEAFTEQLIGQYTITVELPERGIGASETESANE